VWKVAPNGATSLFAGNGDVTPLYATQPEGIATQVPIGTPSTLAVAPNGSVFIGVFSDAYSGKVANNVVRVDTSGNLTRAYGLGNGFYTPNPDGVIARDVTTGYIADIAVDAAGSLYVAELGTNSIRRIGADGILRTFANLSDSPWALAFDDIGNLFVGARSAVYRIDGRSGIIDRVVGTTTPAVGTATGFGGPANAATLFSIQSLALNAAGELFVADDQEIMKVTPSAGPRNAASYANAPLTLLAGGPAVGTTTGNAALGVRTRARSVAVNPTTNALVYSEYSFGGGPYFDSRQVREIASNGCASLRLSSSAGSITATGNGTPLDALPVSQLPRGGGIYTLAKLRSTDLSATATQPSPLAAIPLAAIPLAAITLSSIPLAAIPLSATGGWAALLIGTQYEGLPLQNVTLAQVITLPQIRNVPLAAIDLRNSPLAAISIAGIALGSTPLAAIPLAAIGSNFDQWCGANGALTTAGFDCASNGISPTSTIIDLELRSAPLAAIPLGSIPLAAIPLAAIPLGSIPLAAIPLAAIPLGSIPLAAITFTNTPLGAVPLAAIPLAAIANVVDCTIVNCSSGGGTFTSAFVAGAFKPGATLADLKDAIGALTLAQLQASLPDTATLDDVLSGLVARPDLPWEAASLEQIGLTTAGTLGGSVATYQADFRLFSDRPAGPTTLTVTIPAGFTYRTGTGELNVQPLNATLTTTPIEPTVSGQNLTFSLPPTTPAPSDATVEFALRTGTDNGTSTVTAVVSPVTANASPATTSVTVSVVDPNEPNDTAPFPTISKDRLYIGAIGSSTDRDNFTLSVPSRGTVTEIFLSHLPVDTDLVVYDSTGEQSLRSGALRPAQTGPVTPIVDPVLGAVQQDVSPQLLQDVPIDAARPLAGASARRGTATESVKLVSRGQGGSYSLQVSGYNGASSGAPYLLRVRQTLPPGAGTCAPRSYAFAGQGVSTAPTPVPVNVKTLFLVNTKRLGDTFGTAEAATVVSRLSSMLSRPDVVGAIVPVDANPVVAAAYSAWDAAPCDVAAPNAVVSAINSLVDSTVPPGSPQRTTLQNIVVVGGDDIVPFARLNDDTSYANELEYAADLASGPTATPLSAAMSERKTLSDDPYASFTPSRLSDGKVLYLPEVAIGRLVETPSEITGQIDQYLLPTVNGRLDAGSALTTGYDFLRDGATAVDGALASRLAAPARSTLINDTWNKAALVAALFPSGASPQIASINAHFDHYGALPAVGDTTAGRADLLTTADLAARPNRLVGRLVFSMGCHSGLSVPDAYLGGASDRSLDWAQAFARQRAVFVANTGYGYGDSDTVALSEKLNTELAKRLNGTMTAGQALRLAKSAYAADGITTVYDLKALHQFVFYGLPMFGVGPVPVTPPPPPAVLPTGPDPATGLTAANVTVTPSFTTNAASNGASFLTADGRSPIVADGRPIQPRTDIDVTQTNGLIAHGALITALTSTDSAPFTVALSRPVVDLSAAEPDIAANDSAFPSTLPNIANFDALDRKRQRLSLAVGQWFPDTNPDNAPNIGTQRRFTNVSARVFYRPPTDTDFTPPQIGRVAGSSVGSNVSFQVDASDTSGVSFVSVLYRDGGAWRALTLGRSGTGWAGSGPAAQTVVEYIVQVVDTSGNVASSANKAGFFTVTPGDPTGRLKVVPNVCIKRANDRKIVYRFGYDNPNDFRVQIERGPNNQLLGASRRVPKNFKPGMDRRAFVVKVRGENTNVTWSLDGLQATGTRTSAPCPGSTNGRLSGEDDGS
jgi:hypothetical protein